MTTARLPSPLLGGFGQNRQDRARHSGGFGDNRQDRGSVRVARNPAELTVAREAMTGRVVLVPTMGALHAGHRELIRAARGLGDHVVVSIFVNPTQFGPTEDLDRYPRSPQTDLAMCAEEGVGLLFMPDAEQVYRPGLGIRVEAGELAAHLEGAVRPGHFSGVLTVVAKLFGMVAPHVAIFGEKDYQQLVLIRAMSRELAMGVDVHGLPTVREADGLALSSRNRYLVGDQRGVALALSQALWAGQAAASGGADAAIRAARSELDAEPDLEIDYLALTDPELGPAPETGPARLLVAARLGSTRLIDNVAVRLGSSPDGVNPMSRRPASVRRG